MNTGKFATKDCDDASLCPIVRLVWLFFLARKSAANLRAIAALSCPNTKSCSLVADRMANSRCNAAVKTDDTIVTSSSTFIVCSVCGCSSIAAMIAGDTLCRKIGSRGGIFEGRGIVRTNVAILRQLSISPKFAEITNSDHRSCKNLDGGTSLIQRSTSKVGAFPARANVKAFWIIRLSPLSPGIGTTPGFGSGGDFTVRPLSQSCNWRSDVTERRTFISDTNCIGNDVSHRGNVNVGGRSIYLAPFVTNS
jgi:hypothetical protein